MEYEEVGPGPLGLGQSEREDDRAVGQHDGQQQRPQEGELRHLVTGGRAKIF